MFETIDKIAMAFLLSGLSGVGLDPWCIQGSEVWIDARKCSKCIDVEDDLAFEAE